MEGARNPLAPFLQYGLLLPLASPQHGNILNKCIYILIPIYINIYVYINTYIFIYYKYLNIFLNLLGLQDLLPLHLKGSILVHIRPQDLLACLASCVFFVALYVLYWVLLGLYVGVMGGALGLVVSLNPRFLSV